MLQRLHPFLKIFVKFRFELMMLAVVSQLYGCMNNLALEEATEQRACYLLCTYTAQFDYEPASF